MPTYQIQAPDGNTYRIDGPAGATDDQVRQKVLEQHPDAGKPKAAAVDKTKPFTLGETADIGASLVTGGAASLVGGAAKLGGYVNQGIAKLAGRPDPGDANAFADRLADQLTWSPKTERGKAVMADVAKGLQAFESWTDRQGEAWHDAVRKGADAAQAFAKEHGAPKSVVDFIDTHKEALAAGVGSAVKTTENAAPLILGGELSKLPGRALERSAAAPSATVAPARATAAAPLEVAPSAPRAAPSTVGEGPPVPPAPTSAPATPRARAEAYVRDRLGVSWDALSALSKAKIERVANDATALDRLNPEAVKRQLHLEREGFGRAPITTTAGKLNRDAPQLLREQGAAATPSGQPIRQTDIEANRTLRGNVETLIDRLKGQGKTRATATSREGVGEAVAGREAGRQGALKIKEQKSEANYRALYKKARDTEPNATVSPDPMYEFVRGNPEVLNPQIQHLGWLQGWLKRAGIEHEVAGPDGEAVALTERRGIKLNELDDLRKKAVSIAKGGGTDAHYAGEVIKAIDQSFEEIPDAAKAWKAAREAFKTHKAEFENQGAIQRLVGTKGGAYGTDPKVALEDIWKSSIKNGKLEEIRTLKRSLLSGDAETRVAGKKALRELKAETARDMLREITKGVSTNEAGEANITAESINRWINGMGGREKLDVILGRRATNELLKIKEDAQITKTEPTVRNIGSNTFQKILNWIHDSAIGELAGKIPGGGIVKGAVVAAKNVADNVRAVSEARETATSAAERAGAKKLDSELKREQRAGRLRPPPQTYQGTEP